MPFINVKTNVSISKDKESAVRAKLGKAISVIPGKSEPILMIGLEPDGNLFLQGSDAPAAFVSLDCFGKSESGDYANFTAEVTKILDEELGVPGTRLYVRYSETEHWGFNGGNLGL